MVKFNQKLLVFAALAATLLFLSGCLKTREVSECQQLEAAGTNATGDIATCYHEAAVGRAIYHDQGAAVDACKKIGEIQDITEAVSKPEKNNCLFDIAEILKNQTVCDEIDGGPGLANEISSGIDAIWSNYKERCKTKAEPVDYSIDLCPSAAMVLGVLFLAAFARKRIV